MTETYKCPRCKAGEPVVGCARFFDWHGYTPQHGYNNAEQCLEGFPKDKAEELVRTKKHRYVHMNPIEIS